MRILFAIFLVALIVLVIYLHNSQPSDVYQEYNKKMSSLESNLAEVTLKIESLRSEIQSGSMKSDSDLNAIKKDIQENIVELTKSIRGKVSDIVFANETKRVEQLIEQSNLSNVSKEDLEKYKMEVSDKLKSLELIGGQTLQLQLYVDTLNSQIKELSEKKDLSSDVQAIKDTLEQSIGKQLASADIRDVIKSDVAPLLSDLNSKLSDLESKDKKIQEKIDAEKSERIIQLEESLAKAMESEKSERLVAMEYEKSERLNFAKEEKSEILNKISEAIEAEKSNRQVQLEKEKAELQSRITDLRSQIVNVKEGLEKEIRDAVDEITLNKDGFEKIINEMKSDNNSEFTKIKNSIIASTNSARSDLSAMIESLKSDLISKDSLDQKLSEVSKTMQASVDELDKARTQVLNDYISLNTSKMQEINNSLAQQLAATAELRVGINKINEIIGDVNNLKYSSVIKGNLLDTIQDLDSRMQKYESVNPVIDEIKKSISELVKNSDTLPLVNGFWDYGNVFDEIDRIVLNLTDAERENNQILISEINKIATQAYSKDSNKMLIFMKLTDVIEKLKTSTGKQFTALDKMMFKIQLPLSTIDYIANIQNTVASLHDKSNLSRKSLEYLSNQLDNVTINTSNASAEANKLIADIRKEVASLSVSKDIMFEINTKLKSLEIQSTTSMQVNEQFKQVSDIVNRLTNWIGKWDDSSDISNYVKALSDSVQKNKDTQDQLSESVNNLKKYIGELDLDQDISNSIISAKNAADRALSIIGEFNTNTNGTAMGTVAGYLDSLVSRINQIDVVIKSLDPTDSNAKITELGVAVDKINQTITNLKTTIPNSSTITDSIDFLTKETSIISHKLGFAPAESRTVSQIVSDINAEIDNIKTASNQINLNKINIDALAKVAVTDRQFAINTYDYTKKVESSLNALSAKFTDMEKTLSSIQAASTSASNSDITALYNQSRDLSSKISTLEKLTSQIQATSTIWDQLKFPLLNLKNTIISLSTAVPVAQFQQIVSLIPLVIDIYTTMGTSYDNFAYSKEYSTIYSLNQLMASVWKTNLANMNLTTADGRYSTWASFGSYVNMTDYTNVINKEPLWYYVQRKFSEVTNLMATKDSVTALSANLDSTNSKLQVLTTNSQAMSQSIDKLTTSIAELSAQAGGGSTVSSSSVQTSGDVTFAPLSTLSPSGLNYIFTSGYFVNGDLKNGNFSYIDNNTKINKTHVADPKLLGSASGINRVSFPATWNTVSLSDMYKIVAGMPSNGSAALFNNSISTVFDFIDYSAAYIQDPTGKKSHDVDMFTMNMANGMFATKTGVAPYSGGLTAKVEKNVFLATYNNYQFRYTPASLSYYPNYSKKDILKIIDTMSEFSYKYNCTASIAFGIMVNTNTAEFNFLKSGKVQVPTTNTRIYLDAVKSSVNGTPTLVSDGLLDVSKNGIVLDNNAGDILENSNKGAYFTSTGATNVGDSICPPNSYMCGIKGTMTDSASNGYYLSSQTAVTITPYCCPFRKK